MDVFVKKSKKLNFTFLHYQVLQIKFMLFVFIFSKRFSYKIIKSVSKFQVSMCSAHPVLLRLVAKES